MDHFNPRVVVLLYFVLSYFPSPPQSLHTQPTWPTDEEFLTVNRAIEAACQRSQGVDEELVWALVWEESKYDPLAVGLKGEIGLGQLMPATAKALGVKDRTDVEESIGASVGHLAYLSKKYRNNWQLVLAAYNAGEPLVDRCHCVPTASHAYVDRIQQNRFFAKRIVQYLRESVLPVSTEEAKVTALEMKLKKLEQENLKAGVSNPRDLEQELAQGRSDLAGARVASDRLQVERDRLLTQLRQDNSLGAQALTVTESLRQRLEAVESQAASHAKDSQPGTEANSELVGIRADLAQLKSVIQSQNVEDSQTHQRMVELTAVVARLSGRIDSSSARIPLTSAKSSKEAPLIAVIAASNNAGRVNPDPQLAGALQDSLLGRGLAVNIELQTSEFMARNLPALLAGDGRGLRKVKAKQGKLWNYAIVLQVTGGSNDGGFEGTRSFVVSADSRLYTMKGQLITLRTFSQAGAGFTDAEARNAAITRLGQSVGEFLDSAIQR